MLLQHVWARRRLCDDRPRERVRACSTSASKGLLRADRPIQRSMRRADASADGLSQRRHQAPVSRGPSWTGVRRLGRFTGENPVNIRHRIEQ